MLARTLYAPEHEDFRNTVRRFLAEEYEVQREKWEEQGHVDRALWHRAGAAGLLALPVSEEYGGAGASAHYIAILMEEQGYSGSNGMNFQANEIVASYIHRFGTDQQKTDYLPKMVTGEIIGCLAMTEPSGGSDLQAIKTRAVKNNDNDYIINGSKIFISNGYQADVIALVCKTGLGGAKDISIILVDSKTEGFTKGKPLKKIGLKAQDTVELYFDNVRVNQNKVLGGVEGRGFGMLMEELAWERLMVGFSAIASARGAFDATMDYTNARTVFGQPVNSFQNARFKLAEMKANIDIGQTYVDRCIEEYLKHELSAAAAATAKYWATELLGRVVDECLQLHGGYGYMLEYPIARFYTDARASRIYVGSNEIMKEVIARSL